MKIRCDVCDKAEASVFCSADEAALCGGCDRRVHHANKLASKHMRFSLLHPNSSKEAPLCDICQERRAFLFCMEDRAILCRECDIPIHKANELTRKHNRFLLTGVKLSASSSSYPTISSSSRSGCEEDEEGSKPLKKSTTRETLHSNLDQDLHGHGGNKNGSISTSSMSEYLEILPGWGADDLIEVDPSFASISSAFSSETWEPNLELVDRQDSERYWKSSSTIPLFFHQDGLPKESREANGLRITRKLDDDGFSVPRISPPFVKKSRHLLGNKMWN